MNPWQTVSQAWKCVDPNIHNPSKFTKLLNFAEIQVLWILTKHFVMNLKAWILINLWRFHQPVLPNPKAIPGLLSSVGESFLLKSLTPHCKSLSANSTVTPVSPSFNQSVVSCSRCRIFCLTCLKLHVWHPFGSYWEPWQFLTDTRVFGNPHVVHGASQRPSFQRLVWCHCSSCSRCVCV